jgi:hypothetical protein
MSSMAHLGGGSGMWDEEDGFFYDVLRMEDGHAEKLKVRSMVGLLPLSAATVFEPRYSKNSPKSASSFCSLSRLVPSRVTCRHS